MSPVSLVRRIRKASSTNWPGDDSGSTTACVGCTPGCSGSLDPPPPRVVDSVGSPETTSLIKNIYPTYRALACQAFVVWGEEFGLGFVKLSHYACRLYLRKIPKGSFNKIPKTAPFPDQIQPVKIFQL